MLHVVCRALQARLLAGESHEDEGALRFLAGCECLRQFEHYRDTARVVVGSGMQLALVALVHVGPAETEVVVVGGEQSRLAPPGGVGPGQHADHIAQGDRLPRGRELRGERLEETPRVAARLEPGGFERRGDGVGRDVDAARPDAPALEFGGGEPRHVTHERLLREHGRQLGQRAACRERQRRRRGADRSLSARRSSRSGESVAVHWPFSTFTGSSPSNPRYEYFP